MDNKFKIALLVGGFIILVLVTSLFASENEDDVIFETSAGSANSIAFGECGCGDADDEEKIFLYVVGAVQKPGIVRTSIDARLFEVIELAGGATSDADLEKLNLAEIVCDAQKIVVPFVESGDGVSSINDRYYDTQQVSLININTASFAELKTLDGIGDAMAESIISYRQKNGKFKKISDIKNVSGIGDVKFNNIKDKITI